MTVISEKFTGENLRYKRMTYKLPGSVPMPESVIKRFDMETAILNIMAQPYFGEVDPRGDIQCWRDT